MSLTRRPAPAIAQTGGAVRRDWPVSPLLTGAVATLAGLWLLRWLTPAILREWHGLFETCLPGSTASGWSALHGPVWTMFGLLAVFLLVPAGVAVGATLLQRGGLEPARPADQPRPVFGFRPHQPGLMPLAAVILLLTGAWKIWTQFPLLASWLLEAQYAQVLETCFGVVQTLVLLALAMGLLDLAWRHSVRHAEQDSSRGPEAESDDLNPLLRRQMRERMSQVP